MPASGPANLMAREMAHTDRLSAPWPAAPVAASLRRVAVVAVAPIVACYVRLRERSSSLWVSEQWLAEYERRSSKHRESL